jgi:hypothetical protein
MKKTAMKKLKLAADTVAILSSKELEHVVGGEYTELVGCVYTSPQSFCICPSKYICSINC